MLAKRILIALITLLALVAFMRWGTDYVQAYVIDSASPEKAALIKEIDTVNKSIDKIPKPDEQMTMKLAALEKQMTQQGTAIPGSMDSTLVINSVLGLAQSCNVTVTPLQTTDWSPKHQNYRVYTLALRVEGSYEQIATFISHLENDLYKNMVIASVEITGGLKPREDPDSANLQVAVYTGIST
jgi:hypothetical protein